MAVNLHQAIVNKSERFSKYSDQPIKTTKLMDKSTARKTW